MKFIELKIHGDETADFVFAAALRAVHGVNSAREEGSRLGVTFPAWKDPVFREGRLADKGTLGAVMRVFGDETGLKDLLQHDALSMFSGSNVIEIAATLEVPQEHSLVGFGRERKRDKRGPSAIRRAERRQGSAPVRPPISRSERVHHKLEYVSGSTGQAFAMRIYRSETTPGALARVLSTYGLPSDGGGLPAF